MQNSPLHGGYNADDDAPHAVIDIHEDDLEAKKTKDNIINEKSRARIQTKIINSKLINCPYVIWPATPGPDKTTSTRRYTEIPVTMAGQHPSPTAVLSAGPRADRNAIYTQEALARSRSLKV